MVTVANYLELMLMILSLVGGTIICWNIGVKYNRGCICLFSITVLISLVYALFAAGTVSLINILRWSAYPPANSAAHIYSKALGDALFRNYLKSLNRRSRRNQMSMQASWMDASKIVG